MCNFWRPGQGVVLSRTKLCTEMEPLCSDGVFSCRKKESSFGYQRVKTVPLSDVKTESDLSGNIKRNPYVLFPDVLVRPAAFR